MKENILVCCAHSDDEIVGVGGTLLKYGNNANIFVIIFSYGENSNPLLKKELVIEQRVSEAKMAEKALKAKTVFLGLQDGMMITKINNPNIIKKLARIIEDFKPSKIFTHSPSDFHTDHMGAYLITKRALNVSGIKCGLYLFDVWSILSIFRRNKPKLYVDITSTFKKKLELLKSFKSQHLSIYLLLPLIYIKARFNAIKSGEGIFVERFSKEL